MGFTIIPNPARITDDKLTLSARQWCQRHGIDGRYDKVLYNIAILAFKAGAKYKPKPRKAK